MNDGSPGLTPLASLRRYVRPRAVRERCALCGAELADDHPHLLEPSSRQLSCACVACALLFDGTGATRFRRVPHGVRFLADFRLSDADWEALQLPIDLAFFLRSSAVGRVLALYPSPAGATEALVTPEAWQALVDENPVLAGFEPDVEALLVNRVKGAREYYRAGIDVCYKLVGLIRTHWRGLSGGTEAWAEINRYFARLKERSAHA